MQHEEEPTFFQLIVSTDKRKTTGPWWTIRADCFFVFFFTVKLTGNHELSRLSSGCETLDGAAILLLDLHGLDLHGTQRGWSDRRPLSVTSCAACHGGTNVQGNFLCLRDFDSEAPEEDPGAVQQSHDWQSHACFFPAFGGEQTEEKTKLVHSITSCRSQNQQ